MARKGAHRRIQNQFRPLGAGLDLGEHRQHDAAIGGGQRLGQAAVGIGRRRGAEIDVEGDAARPGGDQVIDGFGVKASRPRPGAQFADALRVDHHDNQIAVAARVTMRKRVLVNSRSTESRPPDP